MNRIVFFDYLLPCFSLTDQKKGNPGPLCMDPGNPLHTRQQRVIIPVHYPGRVHRAGPVTAYPTRTSMDPHGNPITVLTVDQHPDQALYPPQSSFSRGYPALHLDHSLNPHHCALQHGMPPYPQPHAFKRTKFHGRNFSRATCFSQYESMYQHYYFQGLTFPQPEGQPGAPHKGQIRPFRPGLLYPTVVHMAPASSSRLGDSGSTLGFSCYHGQQSVCSGYLADCPGSDSSSSSSGQCHCSSSDSMLDCTEVSNQGVYGSCSTFRSSLSSDYDPYVYRSKSPCRGSAGEVGSGFPVTSSADDILAPALVGTDCLQPPSGARYSSGEQLSNDSLKPNGSSHSSLETREITSTTSAGPLEAGRSHCSTEHSVEQGAACSCCFEVTPLSLECKGLEVEDRVGRCRRGAESQTASPENFYSPGAEQRSPAERGYDGLPCCFYTELQVHRGSVGRYAEDYSVNVQYAQADADGCSGQGCCELAQRIPIIPEDTGCGLGLGSDNQTSCFPSRLAVKCENRTPADSHQGFFTSRQFRGQTYQYEEAKSPFSSQHSSTSETQGGSKATPEALGL